MEREFAAELPLLNEFMTTIRLTTGGVCSLAGLDVDYTEDVKVCVTEALLILKRNGYTKARVEFGFYGEELQCLLRGLGERDETAAEQSEEDTISFALLSALVKDCDVSKRGGVVEKISFVV